MGKARASVTLSGCRASEAEELWYDTSRWPTFVDGFAHVVSTEQSPQNTIEQVTNILLDHMAAGVARRLKLK